jgi:uncharacterized protein (UPF0333 family)
VSRLGSRLMEDSRGQASVELFGSLPGLIVLGLVIFQILAVGYAAVLAGNAAEAGALALAGGRDAADGAREAVPERSRVHMRVTVSGGRIEVRLSPPSPFTAVARRLEVSANATVADG